MKFVVLTPHFAPDIAPTGAVITRIVDEFARLGHRIEVITSLPWYREHRIEPGWAGKIARREDTPWGQITRLHPFPAPDKKAMLRRGLAFTGFTALATRVGRRGDRVDGVLAVSPPLTLALAGARIARARGGTFVFNVQDVFPDVAIELGVLRNPAAIAVAKRLELQCYRRADAITVLSEDLRANLAAKTDPDKVHVVPNFVDSEAITPQEPDNDYRQEHGLTGRRVVMYAGNVGLSQSVDLMIDAAAALAHETDLAFVINGAGAAREGLMQRARGMANVHFVDTQPVDRVPELLAAADIHVVALKKGLAHSSVPSKTYSILAAGRPIVASVDEGSEISRILERSGAGLAVPPEDPEAFTKALRTLLEDPNEAAAMGRAGRAFVEGWASPAAIARRYEELFAHLRGDAEGSVATR